MKSTESLLSAATTAARLGGEVLMRHLRDGVEIRSKDHADAKTYDLVSDADIESEKTIENFLRREFPDHALLGEENLQAETDSPDLWIIDPLDGTNNYAHGVLQFAVSIAYYHQGNPIVAAVFNPARDEMYTATSGGGAFLNDQPIKVSQAKRLDQSLIGCGFYYDRGEMMRKTLDAVESFFQQDIHGIRRFGSASLDLCHVAAGQFGGYFEYNLSPWDFAAGTLIVSEAGGKVSCAKGDPLKIQKTSILASNELLHSSMLSITKTTTPNCKLVPRRSLGTRILKMIHTCHPRDLPTTDPLDMLVVAPHPDDAEIGLGGTIAKMVHEGMRVGILDLTTGEPTPHGNEELRREETMTATKILNVTWRGNAGLINRKLEATLEARELIASYFRMLRPRWIFAPYWNDAHPDHVAATDLIEAARFWSKLSKTDMPGERFHPERVYYYFCIHLRLAIEPNLIVDISEFWDQKQRSIMAYESQFITGRPTEPPTMMQRLETDAAHFGNLIARKYGEPIATKEPLAISSLRDLI